MTSEEAQALIRQGETLNVEFKGERSRPLNDTDLVETVVCLANRQGRDWGYLFVGVEDDGSITGARPRHEHSTTNISQVAAMIGSRTHPAIACRVEEVMIVGKPVLVFHIPKARSPVGTSDGKYLRRRLDGKGNPECVPFHYHEMQSRLSEHGGSEYLALPVHGATWEDLDILEFERFRRTIRESHGMGDQTLIPLSDWDLAKALGCVDGPKDHPEIRLLALLLFGKEESLHRFLPSHEVAFQELPDTQVVVNDFFRWPLLRVMDELLGRFRARYRETEIQVGFKRVGIPDYSEKAFREAVANALIHRDYTRLNAVYIQWRKDRLEISSPGGLPEGVSMETLLVTAPHPRNPKLADAFKRAGYVERTARGIDTIFFEQLRNGRAVPSYDRTTSTDVVLVLSGEPPDLSFVRMLTEEGLAGRSLDLDDLLILRAWWDGGTLSLEDAARIVQKSSREIQGKVNDLKRRNLQSKRIELSANDRLELKDQAFITVRSPSRITHETRKGLEEKLLAFAEKEGSISRAKATSLLQIKSHQAYRLIQQLVEEGKLRKIGEVGRAVQYEFKAKKHE
uniref:Putative transcriptional regulator n=1 Tax=Leptospirillum ferrodiazotrophum TaxID=412449 RepID=C6HV19_9BACT|nr:MAG: putative transcriptional regulator [Leptospirillum ferrodiazotrophum]